MTIIIEPFTRNHIEEAAGLLAARVAQEHTEQSLLPDRWARPEVSFDGLIALLGESGSMGVVARDGDHMRGYLLGTMRDEPRRGRHAWVPFIGHALADPLELDLLTDLYTALGAIWVRQGHFDHYILIPAHRGELLEAFSLLSFGREQAHATLPLAARGDVGMAEAERTAREARVTIRAVRADALDAILPLAGLTRANLVQAPVWSVDLPENWKAIGRDWEGVFADETDTVFVAERDGRMVGLYAIEAMRADDTDQWAPEGCLYFMVGATVPEARQTGVSRALMAHTIAHACAHGFDVMVTDWRTTNREAARTWPRAGFIPVVYRLVRRVDGRIAWGNQTHP